MFGFHPERSVFWSWNQPRSGNAYIRSSTLIQFQRPTLRLALISVDQRSAGPERSIPDCKQPENPTTSIRPKLRRQLGP